MLNIKVSDCETLETTFDDLAEGDFFKLSNNGCIHLKVAVYDAGWDEYYARAINLTNCVSVELKDSDKVILLYKQDGYLSVTLSMLSRS